MPKVSDTLKITIRIAYGDRERLRKYHPSVPYNEIIRRLVKGYLDGLDRRMGKRELRSKDYALPKWEDIEEEEGL